MNNLSKLLDSSMELVSNLEKFNTVLAEVIGSINDLSKVEDCGGYRGDGANDLQGVITHWVRFDAKPLWGFSEPECPSIPGLHWGSWSPITSEFKDCKILKSYAHLVSSLYPNFAIRYK